nr:hypothetical protein [Tanacetum cinerariifolium]
MTKDKREIMAREQEDEVDEKKNYTTKGIIFQTLPENVLLQVSKYKNAKDVWESIKFKSLSSSLEEEMIVRKFLNSVPKKYLPVVAPIEQYSDLETMPFEEAVGRQVTKSMVKIVDAEDDAEIFLREVEETEEEEEVVMRKVEFGAMIVESLGILAMSAQSGMTKTNAT